MLPRNQDDVYPWRTVGWLVTEGGLRQGFCGAGDILGLDMGAGYTGMFHL